MYIPPLPTQTLPSDNPRSVQRSLNKDLSLFQVNANKVACI